MPQTRNPKSSISDSVIDHEIVELESEGKLVVADENSATPAASKAAWWRRISPEISPRKLVGYFADYLPDADSNCCLRVTECKQLWDPRDIRIKVEADYTDKLDGTHNSIRTMFYTRPGNKAIMDVANVPVRLQGHHIATHAMQGIVAFAEQHAIGAVETVAGGINGRYTWARMGFCPDKPSWERLCNILTNALPILESRNVIDAQTCKDISALLDKKEPKHIWDIARLTLPIVPMGEECLGETMPLGKYLLCATCFGNTWKGDLTLDPLSESRQKFDHYVREKTLQRDRAMVGDERIQRL